MSPAFFLLVQSAAALFILVSPVAMLFALDFASTVPLIVLPVYFGFVLLPAGATLFVLVAKQKGGLDSWAKSVIVLSSIAVACQFPLGTLSAVFTLFMFPRFDALTAVRRKGFVFNGEPTAGTGRRNRRVLAVGLAVLIVEPILAVVEGYGGMEGAVYWLLLFCFACLLGLGCYAVYLIFRQFDEARLDVRSMAIILVVPAVLLIAFFVTPNLYPGLRWYGAFRRLQAEGGETFCRQLKADAATVTAALAEEGGVVSDLPQSFRQLGAFRARAVKERDGVPAYVYLYTSKGPNRTGWIIVPTGSFPQPDYGDVEITAGIYRAQGRP